MNEERTGDFKPGPPPPWVMDPRDYKIMAKLPPETLMDIIKDYNEYFVAIYKLRFTLCDKVAERIAGTRP